MPHTRFSPRILALSFRTAIGDKYSYVEYSRENHQSTEQGLAIGCKVVDMVLVGKQTTDCATEHPSGIFSSNFGIKVTILTLRSKASVATWVQLCMKNSKTTYNAAYTRHRLGKQLPQSSRLDCPKQLLDPRHPFWRTVSTIVIIVSLLWHSAFPERAPCPDKDMSSISIVLLLFSI